MASDLRSATKEEKTNSVTCGNDGDASQDPSTGSPPTPIPFSDNLCTESSNLVTSQLTCSISSGSCLPAYTPRTTSLEVRPSWTPDANPTSSVTVRRKPRIKRRLQGEKECSVCGDKAIAHNFGALTCETCKAFFRRNANRTQEIAACAFERKCVINKTTRRFCPSCRMDKCFTVGMDPSFILDNEEKEAMRERRKKKKGNMQQQDPAYEDQRAYPMEVDSSTHRGCYSLHQSPASLHSPYTLTHQSLNHLGSSTAEATSTITSGATFAASQNFPGVLSPISAAISNFYQDFPSTPHTSADSSDVVESSVESSSRVAMSSASSTGISGSAGFSERSHGEDVNYADVCSCKSPTAIPFRCSGEDEDSKTVSQGLAFRHVERDHLPWDIQLYWPLTPEERSLLTLIANCYTNIQITVHKRPADDPPPSPPANHLLSVENLVYVLDATLRRCVSFAKAVPDFRTLQEVDQIACLKASALQTYILRSSALYILERKAWQTYMGDLTFDDLQARFQNTSVRMFADYCAALKSVARTNSTLYALLHCLALFDARDATLQDRVKVNALRDKYILLLKHYLESEYSYRHSSRYLVEIMALLEDVHGLKARVLGFYNQFSKFFRPLVAEFFAA